jgi:quercetin dioxygenase-like cupin family protein
MISMHHILRREDQKKGRIAAVEFEGETYGASLSFFIGDLSPGNGPGLHKHPYPETCIVRAGRVAMMVDGQEVIGNAGDIIVIAAETPHSFKAIGEERLEAICIHASDRFIIEWIDETTTNPKV